MSEDWTDKLIPTYVPPYALDLLRAQRLRQAAAAEGVTPAQWTLAQARFAYIKGRIEVDEFEEMVGRILATGPEPRDPGGLSCD